MLKMAILLYHHVARISDLSAFKDMLAGYMDSVVFTRLGRYLLLDSVPIDLPPPPARPALSSRGVNEYLYL